MRGATYTATWLTCVRTYNYAIAARGDGKSYNATWSGSFLQPVAATTDACEGI